MSYESDRTPSRPQLEAMTSQGWENAKQAEKAKKALEIATAAVVEPPETPYSPE